MLSFVDLIHFFIDNKKMNHNHEKNVRPHHLHKLRHWERHNLPHYGKEAGYLIFLELAKAEGASAEMLKEFEERRKFKAAYDVVDKIESQSDSLDPSKRLKNQKKHILIQLYE
jgi:hypothetical protein